MFTIRDARPEDWPSIWRFMEPIVRAGETFSWDSTLSSAQAEAIWMQPAPGATLVAIDDESGDVVGTAELSPNHGGPAAHIANAGYMVDEAHAGRGVGRLLGQATIDRAAAEGFRAMQFNAVVEANHRAVALWQSLGFEILATVPEAFDHPTQGLVGLHIMWRSLADVGEDLPL